MALKQNLQQKLLQKLSPQQIQLMKLLQLPTVALEQRIKEEIESNPALEEGKEAEQEEELTFEDDFDKEEPTEAEQEFDFEEYMDDDIPDYKLSVNNKGKDDEDKQIPLSGGITFHQLLEDQLNLCNVDEKTRQLAQHLIGSLDDSGYLRRDLASIVDDLAFSQNIITTEEELEKALKVIQNFEPAGVGARSLQECLLIQISKKGILTIPQKTAEIILEDYFEEFSKKHYDKILKKLEITEDDLRDAVEEILKLNPKPGNSLSETAKDIQQIVPDFELTINDGEIDIQLNGRNAPELRVSREYNEMLKEYSKQSKHSKQQKDALMFVKQKIDAAKWFVDAIKQRQQTLLGTINAIVEYQKDYFLSGDETQIKPMILKDIAERVGLDISTISRVVNSKYVQTPYGTFLLKTFFSESLSTDSGEEVSTIEVKKILQDSIDAEDKKKPLTDEKLSALLKEKGYNIARRTVAKYREQLNIPVARLRKEI
ncbi:MAG: RNA polymerase factor sigma-54 [Vicingaceae bacterium]